MLRRATARTGYSQDTSAAGKPRIIIQLGPDSRNMINKLMNENKSDVVTYARPGPGSDSSHEHLSLDGVGCGIYNHITN